MSEGVRLFLEQLGLHQYMDIFVAKGYDIESDLIYLNCSDLDEMNISDLDHRSLILNAGRPLS